MNPSRHQGLRQLRRFIESQDRLLDSLKTDDEAILAWMERPGDPEVDAWDEYFMARRFLDRLPETTRREVVALLPQWEGTVADLAAVVASVV